LIGLTAGTVATLIGGLIGGLSLGLAGVDLGQDAFKSTPFNVALLFAGSIGFIVSGFVTARFSPGDWIFDVGATGFVLLFLSVGEVVNSESAIFPFWFNVSLLILCAPLVLVGARLHSKRWRAN
jgi:peptidoglycan/LPS O-acetylase OafA/YrhL